jgi:hypothetical protein
MKNLIILILALITNFAFGQTNDSGTINLKISFEKDISVENIEVFYSLQESSKFNEINYEIDTSSNSIILKGNHEWWASPAFSTFVFNYQQKDKIFMFYLASSFPPYIKYNFDKKIVFSFETPNVHIRHNKGIFELDYIDKGSYISHYIAPTNELIKIKNEN